MFCQQCPRFRFSFFLWRFLQKINFDTENRNI
jgi:hypothetical protein